MLHWSTQEAEECKDCISVSLRSSRDPAVSPSDPACILQILPKVKEACIGLVSRICLTPSQPERNGLRRVGCLPPPPAELLPGARRLQTQLCVINRFRVQCVL